MSGSEIAQLRAQIERECQALQNMMQLAAVASHHTINARYKAWTGATRNSSPWSEENRQLR